jgi:hypothetical protein
MKKAKAPRKPGPLYASSDNLVKIAWLEFNDVRVWDYGFNFSEAKRVHAWLAKVIAWNLGKKKR